MTMTRDLTKEEAIDALQHIHAQLGKVAFMEPVFWERKEGTHSLLLGVSDSKTDSNLEGRRVDMSNPTYKNVDKDLSFPSPGCGAGAWDGLPPGHKAQPIDLEVTKPVLERLGLPATQEGYAQLFGAAYVGSPLGRGAIWRAAQADAEVEAWRYKVALAAALHYEP